MKKKQLIKKILSCTLALSMLASLVPSSVAMATEDSGIRFEQVDNSAVKESAIVREAVEPAADSKKHSDDEAVRVSIVLEGDSVLEAGYSTDGIMENASALKHIEKVRGNQKAMEKKIAKATGKKMKVQWNLALTANIISADVTYGDIESIEAVEGVKAVVPETVYEPCTTAEPNMSISTGVMTGAQKAWEEGYSGAGGRVAIIDSGLDTDHISFDNDAFLYALEEDAAAAGKKMKPYVTSLDLLDEHEVGKALKYLNAADMAEGSLTADELVVSDKIPYAYNYVDANYNVSHEKDRETEHGSHVAGIAAANRYIETEEGFEDALSYVYAAGNAPDAQVLVMKVFGENGGAYDSDYMAAIEDAILLGCDSVNLSLGSAAAGMTANATYQEILDKLTATDTVVVMSAGNSGAWADNSYAGELWSDDVSFMTAGSPGTYTNSLCVASVDNAGKTGCYLTFGDRNVFYSETSGTNEPINTIAGEHEYIFFDNYGADEEGNSVLTPYADVIEGKVVMVSRGNSSFFQKHMAAAGAGAVGCIVYNNQPGDINMDLTGSNATIPCVSITLDDGGAIRNMSTPVKDEDGNILYYTGSMTVQAEIGTSVSDKDYYTMSAFSSWGVPGSLTLKPEITAPGGNIYSLNGTHIAEDGTMAGGTDQYELMSGTSMAAPQIAGMSTVLKRYIEQNGLSNNKLTDRALAQSLLMSTASPMLDSDENVYSVLQQGAGLANISDAMHAATYIKMDGNATVSAADGKVKAELGDDPEKNGVYSFSFTMTNMTKKSETYALSADVFTQAVEDVFLLESTTPIDADVSFSVNGKAADSVTVKKNASVSVAVTIALTEDTKAALDAAYADGAYVEAYVYAEPEGETSAHSIPVLAFYGNWTDPSMYDKGSYVEYAYGLEELPPYLYSANNIYGNAYTVSFAGDSEEYFFGGNLFAEEETYDADRNAMNNTNGTFINSVYYTLIRNAGIRNVTITDAATGEQYMNSVLGEQSSAFFHDKSAVWQNTRYGIGLNWAGTDAEGNPLPEDTTVNLTLTAVPEYYRGADGKYDLSDLGEGANFTTQLTIDNTAPVMEAVTNEENGAIGIAASDNQYIAAVHLYSDDGETLVGTAAVGKSEEDAWLADGLTEDVYLVQVIDYAGNTSTYRVFLNVEPTDVVESITIDKTSMSLIKGNNAKLTAKANPKTLSDRSVTWTTSDESIATVNADGMISALSEGTCTITAASVMNPEVTTSCEVEVKVIAEDLNGFVWDENGDVWFSKFNTANLPNYEKLTAAPYNLQLNATAYGADGTLYASDLDTGTGLSSLYTIDPSTYEASRIGTSRIGYTELAGAPNLGGVLLGTYFNYIALVDPTTGDYTGVFDWCSNELVGIAYAGSAFNTQYNAYVDIYYLLDSKGNLYNEGFINLDGQIYSFFGQEGGFLGNIGTVCDTPYFQSLYYDGKYLYDSCFNESANSVTLHAVEIKETEDSVTLDVYKLGSFADGVWPVAGLVQTEMSETDAPACAADLKEAKTLDMMDVSEPDAFEMEIHK